MRSTIVLILSVFTIASCAHQEPKPKTANLNLSYASTTLGFRNSGALSPGKIFMWDRDDNILVDLRSTLDIPVSSAVGPNDYYAANIKGASVSSSAEISDKVNGELTAAVNQSGILIVKNAIRDNNARIYNALSAEYSSLGPRGYDYWRVNDLIQSNRYKLVVLRDPTRASSETLAFTQGGELSGTLNTFTSSGEFKIGASKNAYSSCSSSNQTRAICFVDVEVLDVFINDEKKLDYRPSSGSFDEELTQAFRKL